MNRERNDESFCVIATMSVHISGISNILHDDLNADFAMNQGKVAEICLGTDVDAESSLGCLDVNGGHDCQLQLA